MSMTKIAGSGAGLGAGPGFGSISQGRGSGSAPKCHRPTAAKGHTHT